MTTSVRYTGTAKQFFELALTGRARQWTPGQQQDVSDADAATLIATTSFAPANPLRARAQWQLSGTPSAADIALSGDFYLYTDPSQRYVINAAGTAYVTFGGIGTSTIAGATDAGTATLPAQTADTVAKVAAEATLRANADALKIANGIPFNAATNVATPGGGFSTFGIASGTAPANGFNTLVVTTGGTLSPAVDGITTVALNDTLQFFPAIGTWARVLGTVPVPTVPATTAMKKGDGAGNLADAVPSVDYAQPTQVRYGGPPIIVGTPGTTVAVGTNGALTITGTTLTVVYPNALMWFPTGAVFSGSVAGLYYLQFASTSAATVFNNVYTPGVNTGAWSGVNQSWQIPVSPTPVSGTGTSFTMLTEVPVLILNVPAGATGTTGGARMFGAMVSNNSATTKVMKFRYGPSTSTAGTVSSTTAGYGSASAVVQNQGSASAQVGGIETSTSLTSAVSAPIRTTIASASTAYPIQINLLAANAGDFCVLEMASLQYYSAPV